MTFLDWIILAAMYVGIVLTVGADQALDARRDRLPGRRQIGRTLPADHRHGHRGGWGAITVVANLEMGYTAGFAMAWWGLMMVLFEVLVKASGWVMYRFRRTRALTLAEFFERRYSRRYRIFAGSVAFLAGLINFGIFPSVGARFFIYFLGLPETWHLGPLALPLFPTLMAALLVTAVYFVFAGGQVAVMITDFTPGRVRQRRLRGRDGCTCC